MSSLLDRKPSATVWRLAYISAMTVLGAGCAERPSAPGRDTASVAITGLPASLKLAADTVRFTSLHQVRRVAFAAFDQAGRRVKGVTGVSVVSGGDVVGFVDAPDTLRFVSFEHRGVSTLRLKFGVPLRDTASVVAQIVAVVAPVQATTTIRFGFDATTGLAISQLAEVQASAFDSLGNWLPWISSRDLGLTVTSSHPDVARVEGDTLVRGVTIGTTDIQAQAGAITATTPVPVYPAAALSAVRVIASYPPVYPLLDTPMQPGPAGLTLVQDITAQKNGPTLRAVTLVNRDGSVVWSRTYDHVVQTLFADDPAGLLVVADPRDSSVVGIAATGAALFRFTSNGTLVGAGTAATGEQRVYIFDGTFVRAVATDGNTLWTSASLRDPIVAVRVRPGVTYVVTTQTADAYANDGTRLWRQSSASTAAEVDDADNLYVGGNTQIASFDRDGALRWTTPVSGRSSVTQLIMGAQAVLLARTLDNRVDVLASASGARLWITQRSSSLFSIVRGGSNVYIADGYVWVYDPASGTLRGRTPTSVIANQGATCTDGVLVLSDGRKIYRYDGC